MKRKLIILFILISVNVFASANKVLNFADLYKVLSSEMVQQDGSIVFDGKKDYLKMNNPALGSDEMAVYMKFKLTSSDFFNKTFELINTADGEVESLSGNGNWGLSVNYTSSGLWVVTCDPVYGKLDHNFTKFKFAVGNDYDLYIYLDNGNIRIYIDGKCIAEKRLPYGYYKAKNLYIGAGILSNSYSGVQIYDFEIFTGEQSKDESEKLALKGNADIEGKVVLTSEDLQPFVRGKQKVRKDIKIESGNCVTLINPMKKSNSFGAYLDFSFNTKTQTLKNWLELFNTADTMPEVSGKWGLSLNYDRNGLCLLTSDGTKSRIVKTGVFFRENERYSLFVYIDSNDVLIYVNGKCVKRCMNTSAFYKDTAYLHIGAGVLVNSYTPMILHDFKLTNKTVENKREADELLLAMSEEKSDIKIVSSDKKSDFSFRLKNKEKYFLAGAIASYTVSAVSLAFIPVCFGIYGYNGLMYEENARRYNNAVYQEELDLYYGEMQKSSQSANAALTSGIVLIPVCAATLATGVILTVIYQKLKIEHMPTVAFGYVPNQSCLIQFSVPL